MKNNISLLPPKIPLLQAIKYQLLIFDIISYSFILKMVTKWHQRFGGFM